MIRKCSECDRDISSRRADALTCSMECKRYRHLRLKFERMTANRGQQMQALNAMFGGGR